MGGKTFLFPLTSHKWRDGEINQRHGETVQSFLSYLSKTKKNVKKNGVTPEQKIRSFSLISHKPRDEETNQGHGEMAQSFLYNHTNSQICRCDGHDGRDQKGRGCSRLKAQQVIS